MSHISANALQLEAIFQFQQIWNTKQTFKHGNNNELLQIKICAYKNWKTILRHFKMMSIFATHISTDLFTPTYGK